MKKKNSLSHKIQYNVLVLFVISVALVSPLSILPSSYSQEISRTPQWNQEGEGVPTLRQPSGIAVDLSSGNVYVADTGSHRIQVYSGSDNGSFLEEFGEYGSEDGNFRSPEGVAVDQQGNVYVADTQNSRIQVFSGNGTFLEQLGIFSSGDDDEDMRFPEGVAVDQQGNIYMTDTANNRISTIFFST